MNVKFSYLYRDAGNFKNWGEVIFSNEENIDTNNVNFMLREILIDQCYFVATQAAVPDLHFNEFDDQLDHDWHEFYDCELTNASPSDSKGRSIIEFIESLRYASIVKT